MSKPLIWFLIGLGFFLFFIGALFSETLLILGLVSIGAGLFIGLGPQGILKKEQVLDTWAILIEQAQGRTEGVIRDTASFIQESRAPGLEMERQDLAPGMIKGVMGKTREFLVITERNNSRLKPYQIFINSRDYGDNLDVSWHLTYRPSLLEAICSLIPYINVIPVMLRDLDLFDQQDLRAYATNVHHCLLKAVTKLMIEANQDPSKIDRKSRGFLGIS